MRCQRCNGPWPGNALGFDHRWSIRLVNTPFNPLLREGRLGIDPQGTQQLFAPLWAQQDRSGVRFTTDLAYGPDARHRLDVYQPDTGHTATHAPPVVVFVHGGGFVRGDKSERIPVGVALAQAGCVVVVPNYRLGPTHRWPAGAEDVASVVAWVVSHAHLHGATPNGCLWWANRQGRPMWPRPCWCGAFTPQVACQLRAPCWCQAATTLRWKACRERPLAFPPQTPGTKPISAQTPMPGLACRWSA